MPLIAEQIQLTDFFRNGKYITFPVAYIAYVDKNGYIRNIRGDVYTKMKSNNPVQQLDIPEVDPDYYYDIIKTNVILDCKDRVINPKTFVFLVNDTLYDIFGREIKPLIKQEIEQEEIEQIIEQETQEVETTTTELKCNFIYCPFDGSVQDKNGNVSFFVNGNESYNGSSFIFDGATVLQADTPNFAGDWTMMLSFKQPQISDSYQSLICFSFNGDNLFNILVEKSDVYVYANGNLTFIDDLGNNISTQFNKIFVTSDGNVYVNGELKQNVGPINLLEANWNFIIGGDYNTDGSINNYFVGELDEFGVCDYIVDAEKIEGE